MIMSPILCLAWLCHGITHVFAASNGDCQHLPNVSVSVTVKLNGFHRLLIADINTVELINKYVVLSFEFPSGLYVDPYELTSIQNREENPFKYHIDSQINVELPEYNSQPFNLFLKTKLETSQQLTIPFHARYHKPNECSKVKDGVEIGLKNPKIYLKQTKKCDCDDIVHEWGSNWCLINAPEGEHIIRIPVGCLEHTTFVCLTTTILTLLGCIYLGKNLINK